MNAAQNRNSDERKDCEKKTGQTQIAESPQNEDNGEQDSDASSIGVPLVMISPGEGLPALTQKAEKPPEGLEWDDMAIMDCWNLAVATHHQEQPKEWRAPSLVNREDHEFLVHWKPQALPLPLWAVDPFSHP